MSYCPVRPPSWKASAIAHMPCCWRGSPPWPPCRSCLQERNQLPLDECSSKLAAKASNDAQKCLLEKRWLPRACFVAEAPSPAGETMSQGERMDSRSQQSPGFTSAKTAGFSSQPLSPRGQLFILQVDFLVVPSLLCSW